MKGAKIFLLMILDRQSRVITSILTVLSGNTGNISPQPSLLSQGSYFLVLPSHPVNIGLLFSDLTLCMNRVMVCPLQYCNYWYAMDTQGNNRTYAKRGSQFRVNPLQNFSLLVNLAYMSVRGNDRNMITIICYIVVQKSMTSLT